MYLPEVLLETVFITLVECVGWTVDSGSGINYRDSTG